jgi:hypothetical protein
MLTALVIACGTMAASAAPAPDIDPVRPSSLSPQKRNNAVQPSITRATECVAQTVAADERFSDSTKLGDIIVDAMLVCKTQMNSMIDTYDQYYGDGTGEAFFSGPYLDVLPKAVSSLVTKMKQ